MATDLVTDIFPIQWCVDCYVGEPGVEELRKPQTASFDLSGMHYSASIILRFYALEVWWTAPGCIGGSTLVTVSEHLHRAFGANA